MPVTCHKGPFEQFGSHGLEGYYRGGKYRATFVYGKPNTVTHIMLYMEVFPKTWHLSDIVTPTTFKRFFSICKSPL